MVGEFHRGIPTAPTRTLSHSGRRARYGWPCLGEREAFSGTSFTSSQGCLELSSHSRAARHPLEQPLEQQASLSLLPGSAETPGESR